jgi:hypothetical protein
MGSSYDHKPSPGRYNCQVYKYEYIPICKKDRNDRTVACMRGVSRGRWARLNGESGCRHQVSGDESTRPDHPSKLDRLFRDVHFIRSEE